MFKKKDDLKTFFVIVIVCIICVGLILIISKKRNDDKLAIVEEYNVYFSNYNYINNYFNYIANENMEAVYSLLDDDFISNNEVTASNVLDKVGRTDIGFYVDINNMQFVQIEDNFAYYIEGTLIDKNNKGEDFSLILKIDYNNLTLSIYPVTSRNYQRIINKIDDINMEVDNYNKLSKAALIKKEQICSMYLSDFVKSLEVDIKGSYDYISDDMKEIYKNFLDYMIYINNNLSLISGTADKCRLDEIDDKRVYTVIDLNGNTYLFTENSIMDYTVEFYLKNGN